MYKLETEMYFPVVFVQQFHHEIYSNSIFYLLHSKGRERGGGKLMAL